MVVYSMMAQAVTSKILPPYRPPYEPILFDFMRFLAVLSLKFFVGMSLEKVIQEEYFCWSKKICHLIFLQALKNKKNPKNVDFPGFLRGADRI